jgi:hydroxymethylpyrimidine pyrophosphatase-like HAD family hydrolase
MSLRGLDAVPSMSNYFRALAIDYDGTLTSTDQPGPEVLEVLAAVRSGGRALVLVTGRTATELERVFSEAADHFDAIVAENGAVLCRHGSSRALVSPVPAELDAPLVDRGIPFQRGQVLLACDASHELAVLQEIRRLGLDCQLVRNRAALMVLPAGVSKGSGLRAALGELGISNHNAIGIGDAENDLALLEYCEIGVAVGDAVGVVKEHADVTLTQPDGLGVAGLLAGPLLQGELRIEPRRWQIELGRSPEDAPVRLPASQINLLITGGSGSGKSYAAGLLAERLIELGYSVCVFDPEGDHAPLGRLPGVVAFGGAWGLPPPEDVMRLIQGWRGSVVVDLTGLRESERDSYLGRAMAAIRSGRSASGLPHWIFIDEAHVPLRFGTRVCGSFAPNERGLCLVTYRPDEVCGAARASFDFLLALAGGQGLDPAAAATVATLTNSGGTSAKPPALPAIELGQGILFRIGREPELQVVDLGKRLVHHVRHLHKYASALLPEHHRFYFTSESGPTGAVAGNLSQFHREIARCDVAVIERHARNADFSRWVRDVIQDRLLADDLRAVEAQVGGQGISGQGISWIRHEILKAVESRYLE